MVSRMCDGVVLQVAVGRVSGQAMRKALDDEAQLTVVVEVDSSIVLRLEREASLCRGVRMSMMYE